MGWALGGDKGRATDGDNDTGRDRDQGRAMGMGSKMCEIEEREWDIIRDERTGVKGLRAMRLRLGIKCRQSLTM